MAVTEGRADEWGPIWVKADINKRGAHFCPLVSAPLTQKPVIQFQGLTTTLNLTFGGFPAQSEAFDTQLVALSCRCTTTVANIPRNPSSNVFWALIVKVSMQTPRNGLSFGALTRSIHITN